MLWILIIAEASLRLGGFDAWQVDFSVYRDVPGDITPSQRVDYRFRNFDHRCTITINEQGFRSPGRLSGRPFRVLCIGDSSTMGFGVEDHETYPAQLQRFLDGHFPGLFDVLNAGVIGYTIDDELEYLLEKGFALEPSVVVLELFWNDVLEKSIRPMSSQRVHSTKPYPYVFPASWLMRSALYQAGRNAFLEWEVRQGDFPELPTDKLQVAMEPERHADVWGPYEAQFARLALECRKRHIPLIVVVTPHQYQVYEWDFPAWDYSHSSEFQDHVRAMAEQGGAEVIDLLPIYKPLARTYRSLYLSEGLYDEHVGPIGQWVKAQAVYDALNRHFLVGRFFNFYDLALEHRLIVAGDVQPGRLWRPADDNGGLFFKKGGIAGIQLQGKVGDGSRSFVFSTALAAVGTHEPGVELMVYDAVSSGDKFTTAPASVFSVRVLAEFPLSEQVVPLTVNLDDIRGNLLILTVGRAEPTEKLQDASIRVNRFVQNSRLDAGSAHPGMNPPEAPVSQREHDFRYFLRMPLIYPLSPTPSASKGASPR
ncbi:MAG: hypothetical protein Kow0059_09080 [Candidatus Sumerlaeia bacterium]